MTAALIRDERPGDAPAIRDVLETAFGSTAEANIVDKLRLKPVEQLSLVAAVGERVVGHILFTSVTIDGDDAPRGFGLAPMAVLPEFQRSGIGSRLVRDGIARLQQSACPFIVVLGHPEYYPRFGFAPASKYGVRCTWSGVPDEAFMILLLEPSIAPRLPGVARYLPEFDEE